MVYRPWGNIRWMLPKIMTGIEWTFCGCISPEERCLGAYNELRHAAIYLNTKFIIVHDPQSKFTNEIEKRMNEFKVVASMFDKYIQFEDFDLEYSDFSKIYFYIQDLINSSNGNIILDISCFPKRFFFPLVKWIFNNDKINNFIVLNTTPETYRSGKLVENFAEWDTLPFFADFNENIKKDVVFIGVGHMPMSSLNPIQDIASSDKLRLFFPFPGHPDSFMLTWKFVFDIKESFPERQVPPTTRVSAINCSELYDYLVVFSSDLATRENVLLAPYGPKAFSLAMALFATNFNSPVYYTQPRFYYPDYSSGIAEINGIPKITAYALILQNRRIYL